MLRYLILIGVLTAIPLQGYAAAQEAKPSCAEPAIQAEQNKSEGPVWVVEAMKTETGQGPVWVVLTAKANKSAG
ncbi:MAG: hypothetical protein ABIP64_16915 [Burkholderiales bacterium]